eukprot:8817003-Alexandrium_andersonii.AAC.1
MKFCAPACWEADRFARRDAFTHAVEDDNGRLRVVVDAHGRPVLRGPVAGYASCRGRESTAHFGEICDNEGYVTVVFGRRSADGGALGDDAPLALEN